MPDSPLKGSHRIPSSDYPGHGEALEIRAQAQLANAKNDVNTVQRTGERQLDLVFMVRTSTWGIPGRHDKRLGKRIARALSEIGGDFTLTRVEITGGEFPGGSTEVIHKVKELEQITYDPVNNKEDRF